MADSTPASSTAETATPVVADDIFSVTRARQMLALLDRDPDSLRAGDRLPRGWHGAMFCPAVGHGHARPDGFAGIGVALPASDLTRLMFGGRRISFDGDIRIGAPARQTSRLIAAAEKTGRSGRLLIVTIEREIRTVGDAPVVVEQQDYILREAATGPATDDPPHAPVAAGQPFVADEQLLFRYCALTANTHRIHYDHVYATAVEGYPALVVNGNLTALMLSELFRERAGREPRHLVTRNIRPLFCGRTNHLHAEPGPDSWRLWATDEAGRPALEAIIQ